MTRYPNNEQRGDQHIDRQPDDYPLPVADQGTGNAQFDALLVASREAKTNEYGYCFAIEGKHGWTVSVRKPAIRYGAVIEVRADGGQYAA